MMEPEPEGSNRPGDTSSTVPSPGTTRVVKLKDSDVGASYIEFPEDVFFLESLAQNTSFRAGIAYVPAQRHVDGAEKQQAHLYTIRPGDTEAKHVAGPIAAPDGSTDVTVFGSALSSKGILYLCAFNRNSILSLDLTKLKENSPAGPVTCEQEIPDVAAPNDVAIDPNDDAILYVAGGTFRDSLCCLGGCKFSDAAFGQVVKIDLSNAFEIKRTVQADGLNTLAGIEVIGGKIWTAQLFDILQETIRTDDKDTPASAPTVAWKGDDGNGQVWLADNVDFFDDNLLLCPAYTVVPEGIVSNVLERKHLASVSSLVTQLFSACFHYGEESVEEALKNPEVSLLLSNTYIKEGQDPAPIRFLLMDPNDTTRICHFEVDLEQTRAQHEPREIKERRTEYVLGKRHYFNEQVTHAAQLKDEEGQGYVVCVNFEQPRVLLLKDDIFRTSMLS